MMSLNIQIFKVMESRVLEIVGRRGLTTFLGKMCGYQKT